jgi:hypothetical protein
MLYNTFEWPVLQREGRVSHLRQRLHGDHQRVARMLTTQVLYDASELPPVSAPVSEARCWQRKLPRCFAPGLGAELVSWQTAWYAVHLLQV